MAGNGRAVWHDLMTSDQDGSLKYYSKLLDWTTNDWDMGDGKIYKMIRAGKSNIGGFVQVDEGKNVHPHWLAYVLVDDVDAVCSRAADHGGQVIQQPADIPEVGRFGVVMGPEGGVLAPFKPLQAMPEPEGTPADHTFIWMELMTDDPGKSRAFYSEMFDWSVRETEMGDMGTYYLFDREGGKETAGMMPVPADSEAPPMWIPYIGTQDVDAIAAKVTKLGGTVFVPPQDIPGIGRFSVTADPAGAAVAFFKSAS